MRLLDKINSPDDIKKLKIEQLPELAKEVRKYIIETISHTGGHLAPSLGVIELTIALLYVHNPPTDKIIWDVGHQTYGYKVLTGRKDRLSTIRQYGGISGFLRRDESVYDVWGAGHASTSISAAFGFAKNRDLSNEDYNITAVIGDGSLTGGLAFEGLNNAGASNSEMLVILNDNAMSISPNVGALSKYLTEIVTSPLYQKLKTNIWDITGKTGELGKHLRTIARKLEDSFKNMIVPGMLFEQFGFDYYGPIDGHNINELIRVLREIKNIKKPKLLHILTTKGKGFKPAELNATKYHGLSKFDSDTGEVMKSEGPPSYTKIFGDAMVELAEKYPELVAITAAMGTGTGLEQFHEQFPERFFDVGIAEAHAIVFSGAIAAEGRRTVAAIYSTFLQRAYDLIIHDIALQKIPLVLALDRAGIVGEDGPTHHGVFDIAYLRAVPEIVITAPKDEQELRNLLFTALDSFTRTWAIRYPRGSGVGIEVNGFEKIPFPVWELLKKGKNRILILAVGSMVYPALDAAKIVKNEHKISVTVVNCRFIKPMDEELLLDLLKSNRKILTIEEGTVNGGFGEEIAAFIQQNDIKNKKLYIHGIPDEFITYGKRAELLKILKLDVDGIVEKILEIA
ncbi:1-deoxy-D-xylulose-5-phosphate synthase [bacterium]|nr:1-deoxy-D-xylulose-5-phosphate synthase [bacterium]